MALSKIQSESINLADNFAFTGTVTGAGESNAPYFQAYRGSSTQSISAGSWTKVQINTEIVDSANAYDNSTNYRFTPQTAAKLRLPEPSVFKNVLLVIDCGNVRVYDCPAE